MNKACAAKTRVQAKPFVEQSIKAASQAISRYKTLRWRWSLPDFEKDRQKYEALHNELESLGSFAADHRNVYKDMIDSEKAMTKDLQEFSADHYLENKRRRFDELVTKLNKLLSELNRVLYPYKNHDWAKTMKDDAHAAGVRVGTITKEISSMNYDDLWKLGETFRDRRRTVSMPERFDNLIGVGKNLETFYSLVNSIQEMDRACKASAIAARDDAKKALACAKKLPVDTKPIQKKNCPAGWWQRGGKCCAPEINWWDQGAIREGYRTGRCR